MGYYCQSLLVDSAIMVSKTFPIIGEHVDIIFVAL